MTVLPYIIIFCCLIFPVGLAVWKNLKQPFRYIFASYYYFITISILLLLILNPLFLFSINLLPQLSYQSDIKVFEILNLIFSLSYEHAYLITLLIPFVSIKLVNKYS